MDPHPSLRIGSHAIGRGEAPFIIAEMSGNHNGSLERALAIVEAAAKAGAQALKIQTYTADTMTLDLDRDEFFISDPDSLWKGTSLYQLYQHAHTPWDWHKPIFERARKLGLVAFSSPFDATAVDFLVSLDVPCFKIASFENVDLPLIRKAAATGKPLIISTGMATFEEIHEAVQAARNAGARSVALLKCSSAYPAPPEEMNLRTIPDMASTFGVPVGLSDHTIGVAAPVAAVALGASIVEKHFTFSRAVPGPDSAFSLEPDEFKAMVEAIRATEKALGSVRYGPGAAEMKSRAFRRSLFIVEDVKSGERLTEKNVRSIRPADGLHPRHLGEVIGRSAKRDIESGTPLSWDIVE